MSILPSAQFTKATVYSYVRSSLVAVMEGSCVHGEWAGGACECQQGYETVFSEALDPVYCSQKIALLGLLNSAYDPENLLHYGTMAVSFLWHAHPGIQCSRHSLFKASYNAGYIYS